jgi:hypothetical protein
MLPTCTPEKWSTLNMYAPNEISHDPHTKNSRKFIIMRRILIFTMNGYFSLSREDKEFLKEKHLKP